MVNTLPIKGYVIAPPINPWDDPAIILPRLAYKSFAPSPTEAWLRHMGETVWDGTKVNRWIDAGYRLKNATLTIEG